MTSAEDPHDLQRFVDAQNGNTERVTVAEAKDDLHSGQKTKHWIWYIFPQVAGLGKSRKSQRYAIGSREEAKAYLEHPQLGPRLRECTEIVNGIEDRSAHDIFGSPDHLKFRSSMTLFDTVADDTTPFRTALEQYYEEPCERTLDFLTD
jgi:uncharacterized protein (DUF1810 family)